MAPIISKIVQSFGVGSSLDRKRRGGNKAKAIGGTVSSPGDGYTYHTFVSPNNSPSAQTFTALVPISIEVLAQGGGGNGSAGGGSPNPANPSGFNNGNGGSGGAGGSTGVWSIPLSGGTYPIVVGGTASTTSLNSPPAGFTISAGGGSPAPSPTVGGAGASNSTSWTGSTLTDNYPSGPGPSAGPYNGSNDNGRPGGSAGGSPASPTLWWRPYMGSGGAGGVNQNPSGGNPGNPGGLYGGGGGGGQGSVTSPNVATNGGGGSGAKGIVVIRYLS